MKISKGTVIQQLGRLRIKSSVYDSDLYEVVITDLKAGHSKNGAALDILLGSVVIRTSVVNLSQVSSVYPDNYLAASIDEL